MCLTLSCSQQPKPQPEPPKAVKTLREKIEKYLPETVPTSEQFSKEIEIIINKAIKKGYGWSDFVLGQKDTLGKQIEIYFDDKLNVINLYRSNRAGSQFMTLLVQLQIFSNDLIALTDDCYPGGYGLSKTVQTLDSQDECYLFYGKIGEAEVDKESLGEINRTYFACLRYISEEIL